MQKTRVMPTLVSILLAAAALAMFFHLGLRVRVLSAFAAEGTPVPAATAIALSSWLQPATIGVAAALAAGGLFLPLKRSKRQWALGIAITMVGAAFAYAVVFALLPIFNPR